MSATSFSKFRELPVEVRLNIWDKAAEPRIVETHWTSDKGWAFKTYPSPLLSIDIESIETARKHYLDGEKLMLPEYTYDYNAYVQPRAALSSCQTLFHHENDTLYIPYHSTCSLSAGTAVDAFLARVKNPTNIRHLALSLPLRKADLMSLNGTSQKSKEDLEKSVKFFRELQSRGRWRVSLNLKTLTLVFADPVMFAGRSYAGKGVCAFLEIETRDDYTLKQMLLKAIQDCEDLLQAPHSPPDRSQYPRAPRTTSWGNPEVRLRFADRGDFLPKGWSVGY